MLGHEELAMPLATGVLFGMGIMGYWRQVLICDSASTSTKSLMTQLCQELDNKWRSSAPNCKLLPARTLLPDAVSGSWPP